MSDDKHQTSGRRGNAAQPVGERHGTVSDAQTERTGKREQHSAGPDGPDARVAGDAAKRKP
jgi:hypothetical protein